MHVLLAIIGATVLVALALFPIVNPLGSSIIFLGLTGSYTHGLRSSLARRISLNSFLLLLASMLVGGRVLDFFGVSLPVVEIGGGLVVMAMGWNMLQQSDSDPQPSQTAGDVSQQAFYPLTLPITVGPGSISVAVALGANNSLQRYPWMAQLLAAFFGPLIIALSIYICYRSADRLEKLLGKTGLSVFIRLSAFIVLCIGIQILWNGISALVRAR